jgi:drug/metabolite transporter (DMT)-like permease
MTVSNADAIRPADRPVFGALCVMASMLFVAAMDGVAKHLTQHYPVFEVAWARYFFHFMVLLPLVIWRYGRFAFRPTHRGLQILRSICLLVSTVLFFAALRSMPIAETLALSFVAPLVVTALAPVLLGEHVGIRRYVAVTIGFLGALFIIRPGIGVFQWSALLGLGSGCVYALYVIATRKLAGTSPPLVTLAYSALVGAAVMSVIVPGVWVTPTPLDLALMVCLGALAASGHFLVIIAYERAQASFIAPYGYSEMIWATAIGFFVFGDFPDGWTWIGITVICGSGVYITVRERRVATQRRLR